MFNKETEFIVAKKNKLVERRLKAFILLIISFLLYGCASTQAVRKANYLVEDYQSQIQRNIFVLPFVDARVSKEKNLSDFLSTKVILKE